jgi:hypothetical protein
MKNFLYNFLMIFLFLSLVLIIYRIYKYGIIGYFERRAETRKKRQDILINVIHDTF